MAKPEEDKSYYRINEADPNDENSEVATGKKRSRKKLYVIIGVIAFVVIALLVLLLVLLLVVSSLEKIFLTA